MTVIELVFAVLTVAGFASAFLVGIAWLIRNLLRSKSGKTIDQAKAQHKQLLLVATLGPHAKFFKVNEPFPGRMETVKFKDRKKKQRLIFDSPQFANLILDEKDVADEKARELTQECLTYMLKANTEKVFLDNGVSVTLALEDKTVLAGVKGLGALCYFEKLLKINKLKETITALEADAKFKEVAAYLRALLSGVTIIGFDIIRDYFDSGYDQTDEEAKNEWHYMAGFRDASKKEHATEKIFIYGGIALGIIGLVVGAILAYVR